MGNVREAISRGLFLLLMAISMVFAMVPAFAAEGQAEGPVEPAGPSPLDGVGQLAYTLGALLIVCGLAYLAVRFFYGRMGGGLLPAPQQRALRIVERIPLSPQKAIVILQAGERFFLLGVTDQQISFLSALDPDDLKGIGEAQTTTVPFQSYITSFLSGKRGKEAAHRKTESPVENLLGPASSGGDQG